jgi:hypothetical protein
MMADPEVEMNDAEREARDAAQKQKEQEEQDGTKLVAWL